MKSALAVNHKYVLAKCSIARAYIKGKERATYIVNNSNNIEK